jgi:hypothetical protein
MVTDQLGQTHAQAIGNAEMWFRQAEQQFLVAELLAKQLFKPERTESGNLLQVGRLKVIILLLALAIENSMKAVKASRDEFVFDAKGIKAASIGGGSNGHSLLVLGRETGLALTQRQEQLLDRLTEAGVWAGRYHSPKSIATFERSCLNDPRMVRMPDDLDDTKLILHCAAKLAGVNAVVA